MKLISLVVAVVILVIIGIWFSTGPKSILSPDEVPQKSEIAASDIPKVSNQTDAIEIQGRPFEIDPDRLLNDRDYENDPSIQAVARALNLPPACVIASAKYKLHEIPVQKGVCPEREDVSTSSVVEVTPAPGESHPYDNYSTAQLKPMAEYDPAAAIVLARKIEDDQLSLHYYERALVLTGNPMPLIEWLNYRTPGEELSPGESVDVEQAKIGYKIYLVVGAFDSDGGGEGVAEYYKERLTSVGVELDATEKEAAEITARIKRERNILFPDSNINKRQES